MSKKTVLSEKKRIIEKEELKERLISKLLSKGIYDPKAARAEELYEVSSQLLKEIMLEYQADFKKRVRATNAKKVYYLCMEFLVGRALKNDAKNLGVYDALCEIYNDFGISFDKVYECEPDPGLGNGGLGRLAACFMDSLTALDYAAGGYSLLYENGLFKQRIVDGEQVELRDDWLYRAGVRLVPITDQSFTVRFGGKINESWENGRLTITSYEYDEIRAVPYDLLIPGTSTNAVNTIRLWRARGVYPEERGFAYPNSYTVSNNLADSITKQLYPPDNFDEGKLLRLSQQYFLVSASLQSIISDYFTEYGSLSGIEDKISIHINDTHPALCIPELMRILMDVYSYSWEDAWRIVLKTVSYTNHTVLPEALECWRVDLFSVKLPRIYMIITEINKRFTADLWNLYPGDWDRISRMSVIAYNQVRMANLSVIGSHTVNGVSKLHSDILTKTIFHDFAKMTPWKFTNVTNGIVHRRWLSVANPRLSGFVEECVGESVYENPEALIRLMDLKDDGSALQRIRDIKSLNKEDFAHYIYNKTGKRIDSNSIFDVQIKRMHEYKRQLLNVLKIISLYNELLNNPNADIHPTTFIFGCKAAPGYYMAKKIIKLIWFLAEELDRNPISRDKLKIIFLEDYNVSIAEALIPAADLSEQISLAGKDASGTGCMKLMMNGALTIGTLDGANVEIREACGKDNFYLFGMNANEVEAQRKSGYKSHFYYHTSDKLHAVIDKLYHKVANQDFSDIADYLINQNNGYADPFMCLADFESYVYTFSCAMKDYRDKAKWSRMSLINTATSGIFSSDRSIRDYANEIWHVKPVRDIK